MRTSFNLEDFKIRATFCGPLMIWHSKGLSGPVKRTQVQPSAETQLSSNINLQMLLDCQAVVTAQHDHVHLTVDQKSIPQYRSTMLLPPVCLFLGVQRKSTSHPGEMVGGKKKNIPLQYSLYSSSLANTGIVKHRVQHFALKGWISGEIIAM